MLRLLPGDTPVNYYDQKLNNNFENTWEKVKPTFWNYKTPLRSDFGRRQALVEIDVLVALSLDIDFEELITVYQNHFFTFRKFELADQYDQRGQHIPNTVRKNLGGKEVRDARANWDGKSPLTVSWEIDNGNKTISKTFYPPFTKVDREADYEQAYKVFKERFGGAVSSG